MTALAVIFSALALVIALVIASLAVMAAAALDEALPDPTTERTDL